MLRSLISILNLASFLKGCAITLSVFAIASCGGGGDGGSGDGGTGGDSVSYKISVVTSGLTGSGLVVGVSSDAGTETMSISANGTRSFALSLPSGSLYTVGIGTQPSGQSCSIGGSFYSTSMSSDATATVSCVSTFSVGGGITGLTGDITLALKSPKLANIYAYLSTDGSFVFSKNIANGEAYAVSVSTQPAGQTCLVANSGGIIAGSNISNVSVSCSTSVPGFKVGGYVSGFSGVIKLGLNGVEELSTTTNGSFTFATPIPSAGTFDVSVLIAPEGYSCTVDNASGVINNSDYPFVDVDCSVNGIRPKVDPDGAWLDTGETITVTLNGTTDLTLDDWDFSPVAFSSSAALNPGDDYVVTIKTLPPGRLCVLYGSVGIIKEGVAPIISMSCVSDTNVMQSIGGSVTNLTTDGLVINLDGRESLAISSGSTSYTFAELLPDYTSHTASIKSQPAGQICSLSSTYTSVWGSSVSDLNVTCSNGPHQIGGSAIGVTATGLSLSLSGGETINVPADGSFNFSTLLSDGMNYTVAIASQPAEQVCSISNESGYNLIASVSNVLVACEAADYAIKTHVSGYASTTPLLLLLNGEEILEVSANTKSIYYPYDFYPVPFLNRLKTGETYQVTIAGQPEGQQCELTSNTGTVAGSDVSNIGVVCQNVATSAGPYTVNVTTSGLLGSGLVLQLNGASDLSVINNEQQSFSTQLADAASYSVTVLDQPSAPLQQCDIVNASGVISGEDITHVSVQCGNPVKAHYATSGANWLSFIKNDGASTTTASDIACDAAVDTGGYDVCINGGEYVSFVMPTLASCVNITAQDSLNAFNWTCDDSNGVRIISNGLKTGVTLTDLMDFVEEGFKDNVVSVYDSAVLVDETQPAAWWNNLVRVNNAGDYVYSGEINLITAGSETLTLAHQTAALVQPGAVFYGSIAASSKNYLWVEGDVSGSISTGISLGTTVFSKVQNAVLTGNNDALNISGNNNDIQNITASSNTADGVYLNGDYLSAKNITASNNNGYGMYLYGDFSVVDNIIANNNQGSYGISITTSNSSVTNLVANDNINGDGVKLVMLDGVTAGNIVANGNGLNLTYDGNGIEISGGSTTSTGGNVVSNLSASQNQEYGISAGYFANSLLSNFEAKNNGGSGMYINNGLASSVDNMVAIGNASDGIHFFRWDNTRVGNLVATANGGRGVYADQSDQLVVNQVKANNNGSTGFSATANDNLVTANVLANNNGASGIGYFGSSTTTYRQVLFAGTAVNNAANGFAVTRTDYVNLHSIMAINNGDDGLDMYTWGDFVTVDNIVSANNVGYGFNIDASDNTFTGLLKMGSNTLGDCLVGSFATNPGFVQGGPNGNPDNTCVLSGASDGTIITAIDASASVVGKVVADDVLNSADTSGAATFELITDWIIFDNAQRSWGVDGSAFANTDNTGACDTTGENCRIWDWSLASADTVANNVVAVPAVTDVFTMTWSGYSAVDQTDCDTNYPGSVWDGGSLCISTYLRNAQEILDDTIGNDNLLCEAGETCLYMPNIGYYQGHGTLVDAGTLGTGGDTITLKQYQTLGR